MTESGLQTPELSGFAIANDEQRISSSTARSLKGFNNNNHGLWPGEIQRQPFYPQPRKRVEQ